MGNSNKNSIPKKSVIWIDNNINSSENQDYINKFNSQLKDRYILYCYSSVYDGLNRLQQYSFDLIYIIVSGSLSEEFVYQFKKISKNLRVATASIIFAYKKKSYRKKSYVKENFIGGVVNDFDEVINFIMKDECEWGGVLNKKGKYNPIFEDKGISGDTFRILENKKEVALATFLGSLIKKRRIEKNEMEEFRETVYYYGVPKLNQLVKPSQEKNFEVPNELLCKFFMKLYCLESDFYKDMNRNLRNYFLKPYRPFVFIMYLAAALNVVGHYTKKLYRGSKISKTECDKYKQILKEKNKNKSLLLNNYNNDNDLKKNEKFLVYYSWQFLSFSKSKENAIDYFMNSKNDLKENEYAALYILKGISDNNFRNSKNFFVPNLRIKEEIGEYAEDEVLFLPFSCFEITKIEDMEKYPNSFLIYINYLGREKNEIDKFIKGISENDKEINKFINDCVKCKFAEDFVNLLEGENGEEKVKKLIKEYIQENFQIKIKNKSIEDEGDGYVPVIVKNLKENKKKTEKVLNKLYLLIQNLDKSIQENNTNINEKNNIDINNDNEINKIINNEISNKNKNQIKEKLKDLYNELKEVRNKIDNNINVLNDCSYYNENEIIRSRSLDNLEIKNLIKDLDNKNEIKQKEKLNEKEKKIFTRNNNNNINNIVNKDNIICTDSKKNELKDSFSHYYNNDIKRKPTFKSKNNFNFNYNQENDKFYKILNKQQNYFESKIDETNKKIDSLYGIDFSKNDDKEAQKLLDELMAKNSSQLDFPVPLDTDLEEIDLELFDLDNSNKVQNTQNNNKNKNKQMIIG